MLTIEEALEAVRAQARALPPETCAIEAALECVLAEDVAADNDSPPFDKAVVDGYAVRSADLAGSNRALRLGELILAGKVPSRDLGVREAAVVMTGAPIPPGCDAVVMHERTRMQDGAVVFEEAMIPRGQNVLRRGSEMRAGEIVVPSGSILYPARLGVLASVGKAKVRVVPRPAVAIVPTGDELVEPAQNPGPGQIRNSNALLLLALAMQDGVPAEILPIAPDEPARLRAILERGLEADLLVVTGGVSAGQRDLVPSTLESLGTQCVFHKIRLKPGKPLWFGVGPSRGERPGALVFGLPGNPVSSLVGYLVFVRPALAALAGKPQPDPRPRQARLIRAFSMRGDRATYYPARVTDSSGDSLETPSIETLDWSGSADLCTVARADGFAAFPAGDRDYVPGEIVGFLPLR
jgi:molybdopterin molybdotransferase